MRQLRCTLIVVLHCAALSGVLFSTAALAELPKPFFYASFDSTEADVANGDKRLHHAQTLERKDLKPGLTSNSAFINDGRHGKALRFADVEKQVLMFRGEKNFPYASDGFDATITFWMRVDPEKGLKPGYVDPLQITDKKWNDASLFVDFSKDEQPRHFRFGVFSNIKHWNPKGTPFDQIAEQDRPMVTHKQIAFAADRWTHVALTLDNVNSGKADGVAAMYLDGKHIGDLRKNLKFSWEPSKVAIMLGIQYIGDLDEFTIYDQVLSQKQITESLTPHTPQK